MRRGLYCPAYRRTCDACQRGTLRQFGPSSRQGPARSRALVVSRQLKTADANGMAPWRRRCLAESAGACQALSVVRCLPLTLAPHLVPPAVEAASLGAAGADRRQAEDPCGRRGADHAGGRSPSALASPTKPKFFAARPRRQRRHPPPGSRYRQRIPVRPQPNSHNLGRGQRLAMAG